MVIVFRNTVLLLITAILFSACSSIQPPTPISGSGSYGSDGIMTNPGEDENWVNDLEMRDPSDSGYQDGNYNGRPTLVGLFDPVYYNFDSASVAMTERAKLQKAANYLSENRSAGVLLEGHCDWYGTVEYNTALGEERANSARDYLSTLGIPSNRIETLSKGSLEATSGLSKAQSSQDRRVEIIILK